MAKILRKLQDTISNITCFANKNNRYCIIITFKMLKMELKFDYTVQSRSFGPSGGTANLSDLANL